MLRWHVIPTNVTWSKNSQWRARYRSSHENNTRGPAITQGLRDVHCQLKSCQLLHRCTRNPIWKHLQRVTDREAHSSSSELPLFDRKCNFLLVACSNNISIFHNFRDISTLPEYVAWWCNAMGTALDLQSIGWGFKSYSRQCCVTTLGKLFSVHTYVPLSPSSITWYRLGR